MEKGVISMVLDIVPFLLHISLLGRTTLTWASARTNTDKFTPSTQPKKVSIEGNRWVYPEWFILAHNTPRYKKHRLIHPTVGYKNRACANPCGLLGRRT